VAQRWLPILPALLLAAVALHQLHAVRTYDLTPWKGGGFGMFASTDVGPARRLEVSLLRGASSVRVQVPEALREQAGAVRRLPTPERLEALGRAVGAALPDSAGVYRAIRVEFWRIHFDDALEPTWSLARSVEVVPD
jgi:hypothetical protein